jgi:hypothetical protein
MDRSFFKRPFGCAPGCLNGPFTFFFFFFYYFMPCGLDATEIQLPKHGVPHGIDRNWFNCCQPYKILVVPFLEKDDEFESDGTQLLND